MSYSESSAAKISVVESICSDYKDAKENNDDTSDFVKFIEENNISTEFDSLLDEYLNLPNPDFEIEKKTTKFSAKSTKNEAITLFGNFLINEESFDKNSFYIIETWVPNWMTNDVSENENVTKTSLIENAKHWAAYWRITTLFMFQYPSLDFKNLNTTITTDLVFVKGKNFQFLPSDDVFLIAQKFSVEKDFIKLSKETTKLSFAKKLIRRIFKINLEKSSYKVIEIGS